ncbi:innexin inx2-like isoform X1 [Centruroides sculpturatus]|uniref:innexin inx2-like isoform X1 n=1 Tax=Centruroides sculpturatus TaxID=218467 RepID=UPI000C6DEA64|nr:innexin inx2-like isoform X1 [Centruroides sculpturatus]XP_023213454.1 innexin inx2-like isoform X1 [Centruroides sculpturatus]
MLDIFGGLQKILKQERVVIDNAVFRLHWLITSVFLIAFSFITAARQYVGDPIECLLAEKIPAKILDTYCWIHPTFTIPDSFTKRIGLDVPHPGIDNSANGERKHYAYYQWICFVLFLQAVLFYIPYYLWLIWEGGLMKAMSFELQVAVLSGEQLKKRKKLIMEYMVKHFKHHRMYALKYFLCELLTFVNVVGQMFLMDKFFDGEFFKYGLDVIKYSQDDQDIRIDPMIYVFPRVTKCIFHLYGPSGNVETYDVMCVLPLNIVNEKIYIFLWFWFIILACFTSIVLAARILTLAIPCLRIYFMRFRCRHVPLKHLKFIVSSTNIGDWFVLYQLSKNIDTLLFRDVISELARKLEEGEEFEQENLVI